MQTCPLLRTPLNSANCAKYMTAATPLIASPATMNLLAKMDGAAADTPTGMQYQPQVVVRDGGNTATLVCEYIFVSLRQNMQDFILKICKTN